MCFVPDGDATRLNECGTKTGCGWRACAILNTNGRDVDVKDLWSSVWILGVPWWWLGKTCFGGPRVFMGEQEFSIKEI
jgi:hypothetical protein